MTTQIQAQNQQQTTFGRFFNDARRRQGFLSQQHLDAFYRALDHAKSCAECQRPGPGMLLDDGYQPTQNRCDEGLHLEDAWAAHNFTTAAVLSR